MSNFFLLALNALSGFAALPLADAQYCTPSASPYAASNLYTYPLVNQTTPIDQTTSTLVNPSQQAVRDYIVRKHNCLRTKPSPTATNMLEIQWNAEAAAGAQQHASNCVYQHNDSNNRTTSQFRCGQNIAMNSGSTPMSWKTVIDLWYNEVNSCTDSTATTCSTNAVTGHYTQIVWAKTWQIGCGWANCGSMNFFVCNYCPAGNYNGQSVYQSGTSCAACPNNCSQGKLCTNPCPYTDVYSNCATLMSSSGACSTSSFKDSCKATCLCGGSNGLNANAGSGTTTTTVTTITATTTRAPTSSTTTTKATTTSVAPTTPTTTTAAASIGKPKGYDVCNAAYCSGKANAYYQVWPCSSILCGCNNGVATLYGCQSGTYYDGSTGRCKAGNSTWCPMKTPTTTPTPAAWPTVPTSLAAMCNTNNCAGRYGTSFNYFTLNPCSPYWCYCASATSQSVQTCSAGQYFDYRPSAPACAAINFLPYC
ncbi:hypothetical protein RvY_08437 [Ramazzottius varieornatus]|uniref:SCP domain-containing protein n=1 Tax=Ramazzottius varieornatus TaxID=947166 RepID=A0A1D1VF01_RAMVA|nr:hypothetical protein RvY_08437 [Ramazzottius varieornatus]